MIYQHQHLSSSDYLKIETGTDFSFPAHLHQCFEIVIIRSGQMTISVDGQDFLVKEKEALMIFPNQIHTFQVNKSQHLLCIFSSQLVQAYATKVLDKLPLNSKFVPEDYFVDALAQLSPSASTVEKKGLLYSLCAQFDKTAVYTEKSAANGSLLRQIFSFVEANFQGDCSLSALSEQIGYDYSYLSRYFKKAVGHSFHDYVTHYRLSHVCYLFENTKQSILQCAYDSGFSSLRSFNRCFRENFHTTPTQYRSSLRQ